MNVAQDERQTERVILNLRPSEAEVLRRIAKQNQTTIMKVARFIVRERLQKAEVVDGNL